MQVYATICTKYAITQDSTQQICRIIAGYMQTICKQYAQYATKICKKHAFNMQNMHKSMYWHNLHICAFPTLSPVYSTGTLKTMVIGLHRSSESDTDLGQPQCQIGKLTGHSQGYMSHITRGGVPRGAEIRSKMCTIRRITSANRTPEKKECSVAVNYSPNMLKNKWSC